ncbi:hypothetical protein [Haloarcula sp. CGMCC 1.2071]|uniref:hypothetical protein n=1 Tax=Haloarcula sp. CGMCC 1.2071 TaxID=3111454 RepID=UPI00300EE633
MSDDETSGAVTALISSLTVSAGGVYLLNDPVGFVVGAVAEWAIGGVLTSVGEFGVLILDLYDILQNAVIDAGGVAVEPFSIAGGLIGDGLDEVALLAASIAEATGPFAPLLAVVMIAGLVVLGVTVVRYLLEALKWLT